jgi:hypothetical protein
MRIILGIGKGVVHAVHNPIPVGAQVIRPLKNPGKYKENLLGEFVHGKGPVRGIPVKKEGLKEKRQVPVRNKKNNDYHNKQ